MLEDELEKVQKQLCELNETLANVQINNDKNNQEVRTQLELAQTKIKSYKDKLAAKTDEAQKLENELAEARATLTESVGDASTIKENLELLQKLQKAESELARYREKDLNVSDNSQLVIPDAKDLQSKSVDRPVTTQD